MTRRILAVDDNAENRYVMEALFKNQDFEVELAANGKEALDAAKARPPDIIVTDILMPVMDGYDLCRAWKRDPSLSPIPFVFYTATYTDPRDEEFALSLGADRFLIKPLEPDAFLGEIDAILSAGKAASPSASPVLGEEMEFFRKHNEVLFRKLEQKMADLENANALLREEINGRALAEKRIRKLAAAMERSPVSILITDAEGRIEYANPHYCQSSGQDPGTILGSFAKAPGLDGSGIDSRSEPWNAIFAGETWRGESQRILRDGRVVTEEAILYPVSDIEGKFFSLIAIIEDVTHKRKLEEQLRRSKRMEELGQLAGGVAHDFNNILTAIMGFSDAAMVKLSSGDPCRDYMDEIGKAATRAAKLTQTLLSFARKHELRLEPQDLNEIVGDLTVFLQRILPPSVGMRVTCAPEPLGIKADRGQIEQVLMNLVTNARDAMPAGGTLGIVTRKIRLSEGNEAGLNGDFAALEVTDTGMGMDQEMKNRIFEPFFTTKEEGKGTGMGLALVYGIVENHHGRVDVESSPGKGSTFRVYIPMP